MKKLLTGILSSILIFSSIIMLTACRSEDKLPTTSYEKVQFALNGVEKSLKGSKSKTSKKNSNIKSNNALNSIITKNITNDSLNVIYSAMTVEEETNNPSFEYDEPPMIQFQYLKAFYEMMGNEFEFGTKYYNDITGTIYYDFQSRTSTKEEEYLNNYYFNCFVSLNIDSNDLITANVGFELTFENKGVTHHENMYAELNLDYEMNETLPTYELSMNAITDLLDYESADEKYFNDEYDYVKVNKNTIVEWRKFGICSPTNLTEYQNDNFTYKYSVIRAFKESKKYKLENVFSNNENLKNAVIECLDLSNSISNYYSFFNANGTSNEKIKTLVNKFSSIYGSDIVNNLVYTGATEEWTRNDGSENNNYFLRVESTSGYTLYQDTSIVNLFNPNAGWNDKGKRSYLTIYYKNGEDNTIATYNDLDNVTVRVRSNSYDKTKWIDLTKREGSLFSNLVKESGFIGFYDENNTYNDYLSLEVEMRLKSNPDVQLQNNFVLELNNSEIYRQLLTDWELTNNYLNQYVPIEDSIPEFNGNSTVSFSPSVSSDGTSGSIKLDGSNDLSTKVNSYITKLKTSGFIVNTYTSTYTKRISDEYVLELTIYTPSEKDKSSSIRFNYKYDIKKADSIDEALSKLIDNDNVIIPVFDGDYDYTIEDNVIRIQVDNNEIINNYICSFDPNSYVIYYYLSGNAAVTYVDNTLYRIRDTGKSITLEKLAVTLSAVGDFNDWNLEDYTYELTKLTLSNDNLCFSFSIKLNKNGAFKIVRNHSWDNGGYGFNCGAGDPNFIETFNQGANDNIVAKENGAYTLNVRIEFFYAYNAPENQLVVLSIEVV